jgi:hypothetical protein
MPNHVINRLTIIGDETDVAIVLAEISNGDIHIDFNSFAPMPIELTEVTSPVRIITQEEYDEQEDRINKDKLSDVEKKFGVSRGITQEISDEYIERFGFDNWYDWAYENWGTKWNAYDQYAVDNEIEFSTAWNTPYKAIENLSKKYPNVTFNVRYADEDFGYNAGEYTLLGGECILENIPKGGTHEALKIAIEVRGEEEYYLIDYLSEEVTDNLDRFSETLVLLAHEEQYLIESYPLVVLNKLKELALIDEQYERVGEIDKIINEKNLTVIN